MTPPEIVTTRRRERGMYIALGVWALLIGSVVAFMNFNDPAHGHAGALVCPDEASLEDDNLPARGIFHISKSDRIERMDGGAPLDRPNHVWIRVIDGPHAGRTGVITW
jgi:hypothetical protein